jgi:thiopeptide-type bacteriocin biosynthesis protein
MPADQLNCRPDCGATHPAAAKGPHRTEEAVLAVLAGAQFDRAAAGVGMDPADLADAVDAYRAAGRAALDARAAGGWYQVHVQFTDWDTAERIAAASIGPQLQQAEPAGALAGWWFVRKAPCWRLRCLPAPAATLADTRAAVAAILDPLTAAGIVDRWWPTIYEPETRAFGGPTAMEAAHTLFHADSLGVLDYLRRHDPTAPPEHTIGRREVSIVLCSALFRGARQDWHEQGDIWHRIAQLRPLPSDAPIDRLAGLSGGLRRLVTVDPSRLLGLHGPLAYATPWAAAFTTAGRSVGRSAQDGTLQRGIRDVLAHHVIFHWNRLGLPARTHSILAHAARDTVMNRA